MASEKTKSKSKPALDSKDALLQAAKEVFGQKGINGATVKDLADAAGVNVSLVSYYFGGKEGLYRACLETFGRERLAAAERVLKAPTSLDDFRLRLRLFAEEFVSCHLSEKSVCTILHRDIDMNSPITLDLFKSVFVHVFWRLKDFIAAAQKTKILRKDLDPQITAAIMFGSLIHNLRTNDLAKALSGESLENQAYLDKFLSHYVRNLTEGIVRKEDS